MNTLFILNPNAGQNRRRPGLRAELERFIATHRLDARVVPTRGPGHATRLARAAVQRGCARVVAVGGDGTLNEIAQALIGTSTALALVPCGSGNGLALHLGLPTQLAAALRLLLPGAGRELAIDTGSANGHPFCNAMGLGFDAEISRRFNQLRRRGLAAYFRTGLAALVSHRAEEVELDTLTARRRLRVLLLAVANSDQYGNHARIAPRASVRDGTLNLTAIGEVGPFGAVPLAARLFLGTIDRSPHVFTHAAREFVLTRTAPGLIHTDGETHATDRRLHIRVHPASLRLVVPAATAERETTNGHEETRMKPAAAAPLPSVP